MYVNLLLLTPPPPHTLTALQQHYRHLEALALEHEEVEKVADLTEPDLGRISRRAGALLREFKEMAYPDGYDPEGGGGARKRVNVLFCVRV